MNNYKTVIGSYHNKFLEHGSSVKSLMWDSYASAAARYKELVSDLNFSKKSVLDIGCGFGDAIPYIANSADLLDYNYTGIDIMPEFIKEAQKRYLASNHMFIKGDYFKNPLKEKFDYILCCGALNGNYGEETMKIRKQRIKTMFNNCKWALAFNMAGGIDLKNKNKSVVYYANSLEILNYCLKLTRKVIFRHHYNNKDFTVIMFKG